VVLGPAGVVVESSIVEGADAGLLVVTPGADGAGDEPAGAELEADGTGMVVKSEASHLVQIVEIDVVYTVETKGVVRTSVVLPLVTVWPTGHVVT